MEDEEQVVPVENTRPVSDPDEVRQILEELLKRTEAMEARLERILARKPGWYWFAEDDTGENSETYT